MRPSRRTTIVATSLLLVCLAGSLALSWRLDQVRDSATLEEILYVPSPKALKRMSLGYQGLLADIYWTRAVQYFGSKHHVGAMRYDLLAPLLEITTYLDPQLIVAYEYGGNFLAPAPPNGAGQPVRAMELTEFGIRNNPNEWRLYYQLGFIRYMELKDYAGAAQAFAQGSQVPKAHPFLRLMAGKMAEHAGDIATARMMWSTAYETTQDKAIKANAAAHLRALQVDEDVTNLEALVQRYKESRGHLPAGFYDLEMAGMLRGVPRDPLGNPYRLMPDGRVEVKVPDDLPFIQKGTPKGYEPPLTPKFLPTD